MITKVRIQNFKAIQDSNWIPINPFTAFIGNNGSGKSSVIEALELLYLITREGMNEAFKRWGSLESVRNNKAKLEQAQVVGSSGFKVDHNPIIIEFHATLEGHSYEYKIEINSSLDRDLYIIQSETLFINTEPILNSYVSDSNGGGSITFNVPGETGSLIIGPSDKHLSVYSYLQKSIFGDIYWTSEFRAFYTFVTQWQFVNLNSHIMGIPYQLDKTKRSVRLESSGANIAEFVLDHFKTKETLDSLVAKMEFVLPYLSDIQVRELRDFGNRVFLEIKQKEETTSIPSWLFSTGTLRILALLGLFTADEKPSAVFIEEIENGLDPRTIGLVISEIESVFNDQSMQVFITTHSPYLLDLVPLESIVFTDKTDGACTFSLPRDIEGIEVWKKKFSPGSLYSMGKFLKK